MNSFYTNKSIYTRALRTALSMLLGAVLLASCDGFYFAEDDTPTKTLNLIGIPSSLPLTNSAANILRAYNNPNITISQQGGAPSISTNGLYILSIFVQKNNVTKVINDLTSGVIEMKEMPEYGEAFALTKINKGTAKRPVRALNSGKPEFGFYWEPLGTAYEIFSMILTPDARSILEMHYTNGMLQTSVPPEINYNYAHDTKPFFWIKGPPDFDPAPLLAEDFITQLAGYM